MEMLQGPVLLTGATGFVGGEVLARLLEEGDSEVRVLVRARDQVEADIRLRTLLAGLVDDPAGCRHRVRALRGDLTEPRLGLDDDTWEELAAEVVTIVHGAASVAFGLSLAEARAINVSGTDRVLDLAEHAYLWGRLQRLVHVSTAYVAGDRRGIAREEQHRAGRFRNTYERSKWEAERRVHASAGRVPVTVCRPSIVVGDSATGWTASFNVVYGPLRAFAAGAFPVVPARRHGPVDVVPVDYVAAGVLALAGAPEAEGGTFHLAAGDRASSVGELVELASSAFGRRAPRLLPAALNRPAVHRALVARRPPAARRWAERNAAYFPYLSMRVQYDDARARAVLGPRGVAVPELPAYFGGLMAFAEAAGWGRSPIGRAEARRRAGLAPVATPVAA